MKFVFLILLACLRVCVGVWVCTNRDKERAAHLLERKRTRQTTRRGVMSCSHCRPVVYKRLHREGGRRRRRSKNNVRRKTKEMIRMTGDKGKRVAVIVAKRWVTKEKKETLRAPLRFLTTNLRTLHLPQSRGAAGCKTKKKREG